MKLQSSISRLPETDRKKIVDALNAVLTDGIDLYGQIKIAHWNIKGPLFPAVHPLLDTIATDISAFNDSIAERGVTLGGLAVGTARHVAKHSRLEEHPQHETHDIKLVALIAERLGTYVDGAKAARKVADKGDDLDTSDLLTSVVTAVEKHGWFLKATATK